MLFNSVEYLVFLPTVAILYYVLPHRFRWVLILLASYFFYLSWNPAFLTLIVASTLVDYTVGRLLGRQEDKNKRRLLLFVSLAINLGLLGYFKYANFFLDSANRLSAAATGSAPFDTLDIILPVGISFYTFQTLSYTIDVYRRKLKPETHLGIFAVYVSFFPQLVAGPIERASNLLPQMRKKQMAMPGNITSGVQLIIIGLFKKIVLADRLAIYVNNVYGNIDGASDLQLILATYMFGFQILMDFSGYSDIAIGSARILGIDLMKNFDFPYLAGSVTDFWRRWHISLTTWFTDYIYIPLGGNRKGRLRKYINILIVFFISGIWHGAGWNFIFWGSLNGIYLVVEDVTKPLRKFKNKAWKFAGVIFTFNLVMFSWIFFRSAHIGQAKEIISRVVLPSANTEALFAPFGSFGSFQFALLLVMGLALAAVLFARNKSRVYKNSRLLRLLMYIGLVFFIVAFGSFGHTEFIYFQF